MTLKLRAWSKNDLKKDIFMKFETVKNPGIVRFEWNDDINKHPFTYDLGIVLADDDWLVEQYIGLKDKNGKEIYVNDIVRTKSGRKTFKVVLDIEHSSIYLEDKEGATLPIWPLINNIEVIGNVHESKDLIE